MKRLSRIIGLLPYALPAVMVIALVRLPSFGWESLLILGGTAVCLPFVFASTSNFRN